MHRQCLYGPINSYHSFLWSNLILCLYNVETLNICMKEFIIFVCTDSTEIFLSKLRSPCSNYKLPSFSLTLTVRGVSNKHCLLTFFIVSSLLKKTDHLNLKCFSQGRSGLPCDFDADLW